MATKKGPLQTRIEPRRLPLLADKAEQREVVFRWMDEDQKKLLLLCAAMGIPDGPDRYFNLALALARKHYVGFQQRVPAGKWNDLTRGYLVVEIERLTKDKRMRPGHSVSWAADQLARRDEWADFLGDGGRDPGEALRVQYEKFSRDPFAEMWRKAFKWHTHQGTLAEWDINLKDALRKPHQ